MAAPFGIRGFERSAQSRRAELARFLPEGQARPILSACESFA